MTAPLRIALAGLGTVGAGVVRVLEANAELIARRAGRSIEVSAVSARDRHKDREVDLSRFAWEDDTRALAERGDVDVVVELIGGSDGPALALARGAFAAGKGLVTANKAMLAHHGLELARAAEQAGVALRFEAAVAGGVPVVKGLREGAAANRIGQVYGVLNGTCNFILSRMESEGRDFDEVLREAQAIGFAESDPSFDIDGVDAGHKLAILASLAFGTEPAFEDVALEGIRHVLGADIAEAAALGYRVRLLGIAETDALSAGGALFQRVHPCLVPISHPLAHVSGATNAVVAEGDFVGCLLFQGAGAGAGPTASAVVADLIDIARGNVGPPLSMPSDMLTRAVRMEPGERRGRAYLRFTVADRVGVLAEIAAAMRDAGVSIESLIQRGAQWDGSVLVAIVTHEGPERCVTEALERLRGSQSLAGRPMLMHILD
ncbi:homoserine dehydrogenase [uncultured Sphingomonas sp.]|uniref:homoserine dehydrogenase n=1 Tax=uncultured Sphingomonas sp. TaxID=158754 RepID=UPI0035CADFD1